MEFEARLNPFPGLRPFEPDEDHLFFGREKQRQVFAGPLRTDPIALQRTDGECRIELARRHTSPR